MGAELAACGAVAVAAFVSWTGTHGPQVGGHPARDQRGGQVDEPGRQALSEQAGNDWLFRQMDLGYCTCSRRDRLEADRHLDSAGGLGGDRHRGDIEPYAGGAKTGEARFVLPRGVVGLAWLFLIPVRRSCCWRRRRSSVERSGTRPRNRRQSPRRGVHWDDYQSDRESHRRESRKTSGAAEGRLKLDRLTHHCDKHLLGEFHMAPAIAVRAGPCSKRAMQ